MSAVVLVAVLSACTAVAPQAEGSRTPGSPSSTPAPSMTDAADPLVVIGVSGVSFGGQSASYSDAGAVIALLRTATGQEPTESVIEDPWGNGTEAGRKYDFGAVSAIEGGGIASVSVAAASEQLRFETAEGLSVGSTRAAAEAAGAWEEYAGGSGIPAALAIDPREVAGTTSLSRPGETGREYVLLILDGDIVAQIQAPGNDFGDL